MPAPAASHFPPLNHRATIKPPTIRIRRTNSRNRVAIIARLLGGTVALSVATVRVLHVAGCVAGSNQRLAKVVNRVDRHIRPRSPLQPLAERRAAGYPRSRGVRRSPIAAPLRRERNYAVPSRFGRCPTARRRRPMTATLDAQGGDPWQIIADLRRELDARTAELQEKNERYALVSQAVAEGIYDWDIACNALWVSPRLIELFGWEEATPDTGARPSQEWNARVHPEDFEHYRAALRAALKGETPRLYCEYRIRLSNGEYRWVEDHALPVRDERDWAVRLVGAVSDITDRKRQEQELREALDQQTATAEVLRVISGSATDVQPVFEAITARAAKLCEAEFSAVARFEDGLLRLVAVTNLLPDEAKAFHSLFPRPAKPRVCHGPRLCRRPHGPCRGCSRRPRLRSPNARSPTVADRLPDISRRAHPARRPADRCNRLRPASRETLHNRTDRTRHHFRRPSGDCDRECTAVR